MAIIFVGGELSSFTRFNAIETTRTGTFTGLARCGIHVMKNGFIRTDALGNFSDVWLHYMSSIEKISSALTMLNVQNSIGVSLFSITSDGKLFVSGTQIGSIPITLGRFTFDIHLMGGAQGILEVYIDGQVVFSKNGNYSFADMQSLILAPAGSDNTNDTFTVYSQVIVANETTIGMKLATLSLDSVGSNAGWVGTSANAANDVNEIGLDQDTYIWASTAGQVETWNTGDLPVDAGNVKAVVISALGKYSTAGPKNIDAITRINGGLYASSMTTLGVGYTPSQALYNVNPVTNTAWTINDVNSAEFGIRSKI